jgi:hypothetical protein
MTSLEDRLRDAYRAVTDAVREDELRGLDGKGARTRRRGRFSAFAPLAAAAAVVVAIVASVAVPKLAGSPGGPAAPAGPGPGAGTPPFVLIVNKPDSQGNIGPLVVVSAATGRVTGKVPAPRKGTTWSEVALTGSATTFVVSATPARGGLCNPTYLYTLTLSASGAPASLKPWTDPVVPLEIGSITASADGGALAFVAYQCRGSYREEIGFIRGRTMKAWQQLSPGFAGFLSLSADGSLLGYAESDMNQGGTARVLDTGSAPGSLTAVSKVMYTYPADGREPVVTLGADGATMYVSWVTGRDSLHLAGYRIGSAGVQGTLFRRTLPGGVSVSWAGSQLLVWDPRVAVYLVDPLTGNVTKVRGKAWTGSWGIYW